MGGEILLPPIAFIGFCVVYSMATRSVLAKPKREKTLWLSMLVVTVIYGLFEAWGQSTILNFALNAFLNCALLGIPAFIIAWLVIRVWHRAV
jgi:hypothetical protein